MASAPKLTFAARKLCLSQPQRRLRRSLAEPVIFSKPDACCGWWTLATANIWGLGPINRGGGCAKIFGAMQYLCSVELNACVHLWLDVYRASLMDMSYLCLYRHFFFLPAYILGISSYHRHGPIGAYRPELSLTGQQEEGDVEDLAGCNGWKQIRCFW